MNIKKRMAVTDAANEEIVRLKKRFKLKSPQLIQRSVLMLRRYVEAKRKGYELQMVNPVSPRSGFVAVEMPVQILEKGDVNLELEIEEIWKAFKDDQDRDDLRNILVERYHGLVRHHAWLVFEKLPRDVLYDDLVSAGLFGLIGAINKFDLERGIKFETYCALRIRGAIIDELRNMGWVPRLARSRAKKLDAAREAAGAGLTRLPTDAEVAREMDFSPDAFNKFKGQAESPAVRSLDDVKFVGDWFREFSLAEYLQDVTQADPEKKLPGP